MKTYHPGYTTFLFFSKMSPGADLGFCVGGKAKIANVAKQSCTSEEGPKQPSFRVLNAL